MRTADVLTWSRAVAAVLLIPAALRGHTPTVLALLAWAAISDAVDGPVARYSGAASIQGAQRDSLADCMLYCVAPVATWYAVPAVHDHAAFDVGVMVIAYVAPITYGFAKFGRLTSYHTTAARLATCLLAAGLVALIAAEIRWLLHVAVGVLVVSAVEEVAISYTLPVWTSSVPSWRALRRVPNRTSASVAV